MASSELTEYASAIATRLAERGETVAVAESAAGGLISAALVAVPGASAYYRGGLVVYTVEGARAFLSDGTRLSPDLRGATEAFARWLSLSVATKLVADWGIGETGAAGPVGNPYGDPAGHAWVALTSRNDDARARHVLTGTADRAHNMHAFAAAALKLLLEALT